MSNFEKPTTFVLEKYTCTERIFIYFNFIVKIRVFSNIYNWLQINM